MIIGFSLLELLYIHHSKNLALDRRGFCWVMLSGYQLKVPLTTNINCFFANTLKWRNYSSYRAIHHIENSFLPKPIPSIHDCTSSVNDISVQDTFNYDVDSDEEWIDEPGENLSDDVSMAHCFIWFHFLCI